MRIASLWFLFLAVVFIPQMTFAGDVESFNSRLFDLQYFTRPFERTSLAGGTWLGYSDSIAAALQNPAMLAGIQKTDLFTYWTLNSLKGETYGLEELIPPGPGHPNPERIYETPRASLSNIGAYQVFRPNIIPGAIGVEIDYLWNDLTNNEVSKIVQDGARLGLSYGTQLSQTVSIGYELTYLEDTWQWTVTWPHFLPGSPIPQNVDYLLHSEGKSWRHRIGLRGEAEESLCYEIVTELGHGSLENTWNRVNTGGDHDMQHYGIRGGVEYRLLPRINLAVDLEWHRTLIEFGYHAPEIKREGMLAKWDTEVFRPMIGIQYELTEAWQLFGGYRYNIFHTEDLCQKEADNHYNTYSLGSMVDITNRIHLLWNLDYSTVDPEGELMSLVSVQVEF